MPSINEALSGLFGAGGTVDVQKMIGPVMEMVASTPDGIKGLVGQLQSSGLGEQVSTWVGTGENAKVDPSKLTAALGPERVQAVAAKAGVSVEQAASSMAALLPQLVDKLTPGGSIPGADQAAELAKKIPGAEGLTDQVTGLLGGLLGGGKPAPSAGTEA
jgi:uncharacterized protein YidB (DUF937 family)